MPILVKLEPPDVAAVVEATSAAVVVPDKAFDETFEVAPAINETVTIATAAVESEKNPHESLMTEDNDDYRRRFHSPSYRKNCCRRSQP